MGFPRGGFSGGGFGGGGFAGGGGFTPALVAGLRIWLDANSGGLFQDSARTIPVVLSGDPVGSWSDVSGNGNNLDQAVAANQPTWVTNLINGLPAIRFDGVNDFLAKTGLAGDASWTVFYVVQKRSAPVAGVQTLLNTGSSTARLVTAAATDPNGYVWNNNQAAAAVALGGIATNVTIVVFRVTSAAVMDTWMSGAGAVNFDPDGAITTITVRRLGGNSLGGEAADIDLAEYVEYDSALTSAQLNAVGSYLATKYGLAWTTVP